MAANDGVNDDEPGCQHEQRRVELDAAAIRADFSRARFSCCVNYPQLA
jgi:hypothetical protein